MIVEYSSNAASLPINIDLQTHLLKVSETELAEIVKEIAIPRHFHFNKKNNEKVAEWIFKQLKSFGYEVHFQGPFSNIVAFKSKHKSSALILIGAHYDSVPNCPG